MLYFYQIFNFILLQLVLLKEQREWRKMSAGEYSMFLATGRWHGSDTQRLFIYI